MPKRLFILLFIVASGFTAGAQTITISGRVCDPDSVPLTRATITSDNKMVFTNKTGIFMLKTSIPATLVCTHPGYRKKEIRITKKDIESIKNDTLYLPIILVQVTVELPTVDINSSKIERAYDKPTILILDFDFYKNGLMLLLKENKKYHLRVADENSNTLCDVVLRNQPTKLFRDCYNNMHVLGPEYGYQVFCTDTMVYFIDSIPTPMFNDLLLPCVASSKTHLFFSSYTNHNQSVAYLKVSSENKETAIMHNIDDTESARFVDYFYRKTMADIGYVNMVMGEVSTTDLDKAREVEQDVWYYAKVLNRPVYNPLLPVRDSFIVFNHVRDSMIVFNSTGVRKRNAYIDYHYKNGWKEELLVDAATGHVFAKYLRGGLVYLLEINTCTGKSLNEYEVEQHAFAENIKIKNGYAYYLYATKNNFTVTNVYRQKLK